MGGTAGGCLFACPPPGPLLQPQHYHCAPVLLAIFGSQAQKYAGDVNNSFFEFGQEDRALVAASSAVLGGLGCRQAGAERHPRAAGHTEHPAALAPKCPPKLSTLHPFKEKERRDQRSSGSPGTGHVFNTNYCTGEAQQKLIHQALNCRWPLP